MNFEENTLLMSLSTLFVSFSLICLVVADLVQQWFGFDGDGINH